MVKESISFLLKRLGFTISRINNNSIVDDHVSDHCIDMKRILNGRNSPVIFDIGANRGQSIQQFLNYFPNSKIYSFEPGPKVFMELSANYSNVSNVHLENIAIGSVNTKKEFFENEVPEMSSFLEIYRSPWGGEIPIKRWLIQ